MALPTDPLNKAAVQFCNFCLSGLSVDSTDRPALTTQLNDGFRALSSTQRSTLEAAVKAVTSLQELQHNASMAAEDHRARIATYAQPCREKLWALDEFLNEQRAYQQVVRARAHRTGRVRDHVVAMGFPAACNALLNAQVQREAGWLRKVQADIEAMERDVAETEKAPGLNPRKVRWREPNEQERQAVKDARRKDVQQAPLEYYDFFTGHERRWVAIKTLGGGMSAAALWIQLDAFGSICNRVVRKDTPVKPQRWADTTRWHGDMWDPYNRQPLEFYCQDILQRLYETKNVAWAHKFEIDVPKLLYRLYLAFCPFGDLDSLIIHYGHHPRDEIPEPLLWYFFESLAETGLLMERGYLNAPSGHAWQEIVHRDLKPANVFLDFANETTFPRYPAAKLADFGLAFTTSPSDPLNPTIWNAGGGTQGYLPPEQLPFIDEQTREPVDAFQLLSHTNVWGVGAIMLSLLRRGRLEREDQLRYLPGTIAAYGAAQELQGIYSEDLLELVNRCLRFDPAERICFADLLHQIRQFVTLAGNDGGRGQYWREAREGQQPENQQMDIRGLPKDRYKIGFAVDQVQDEHSSRGSGERTTFHTTG